jgi:hypothetical protein
MGKRMSFAGFLTITVLICLLVLACTKKQDENQPPQPPDNTTTSEPNEPNSPAPQEPPFADRITGEIETDSNEPELTEGQIDIPAPPGLILAIAYSDKPAVLIGKELLSEGDTIQGVKVIKIDRDIVEFEKNGRRWTQQAGETPPAYWADPNS